MAELMMITHSVIHAALARQPFPTITLAAFSIAFAISIILGSLSRTLLQIVLSFAMDRRSTRKIWLFGSVIAAFTFIVTILIALTPLGDLLYGTLFGASDVVVEEARTVTLIFSFIAPFQLLRDIPVGLLMKARRTIFVTYGTLLRLISLAGFLILFSYLLEGASIGAASLFGCIAVEAIFVFIFAFPIYQRMPELKGELPTFVEIYEFSWPVMANMLLENAIFILINVFLGRLTNPDLALASFGVTRGLLMLVMSPFRNLTHTAQALVKTLEDLRTMVRFTWLVAAFCIGLILILFYTPLRSWLLGSAMGLTMEFVSYTEPAVLIFLPAPFFWAFAATNRGLLAGCRQTRALAWAAVFRLVVVAVVCSICLLFNDVNGAVIGISALILAIASEAGLLRLVLWRFVSTGQAYSIGYESTEALT